MPVSNSSASVPRGATVRNNFSEITSYTTVTPHRVAPIVYKSYNARSEVSNSALCDVQTSQTVSMYSCKIVTLAEPLPMLQVGYSADIKFKGNLDAARAAFPPSKTDAATAREILLPSTNFDE